MYKCNRCYKHFEEPFVLSTTYEKWYGVDDLFENQHDLDVYMCPNCKSEDIEGIREVEDDEG